MVKRKRYQPSVEEIYKQSGLTPVLVVIGGSRSYGMDSPQDTDYFGYHVEEDADVTIGGDQWRGPYWNTTEPDLIPRIRSCTIESVVPRLRGDLGNEAAMYCMDNWIFHRPIIETEVARNFRTVWVYPFLKPNFAVHYARCAKAFYTASKNTRKGKVWNRALRVALTAKHLESTGEIHCDFRWLKDKYGSGTLEHVVELIEEITGLIS